MGYVTAHPYKNFRLTSIEYIMINDTRAGIMRKYSGKYAKINASFVEKQSEIMRKLTQVLSKNKARGNRKTLIVGIQGEGRGAHMRVATQCKNTR